MTTDEFLTEIENLGYGFHDDKRYIEIFCSSDGNSYRRIATVGKIKKGIVDTHTLYQGCNSENDDELLDLIFEYIKTPVEEREMAGCYAYFLGQFSDGSYFRYALTYSDRLGAGLVEVSPQTRLRDVSIFEEGDSVLDDIDLSMFVKVAVNRDGTLIKDEEMEDAYRKES